METEEHIPKPFLGRKMCYKQRKIIRDFLEIGADPYQVIKETDRWHLLTTGEWRLRNNRKNRNDRLEEQARYEQGMITA